MSGIDSRAVLWANVQALMQHHWKGENINRLAREAGVGPATVDRLKKQKTSVGIEVIDKLAPVFALESWQLLVPGLQPASTPALLPQSEAERAFYARMLEAAKALKLPK